MSKPSEWGAPLPSTLEPAGMVSVCLYIPDTLEYRSAFWGQLWQLGNAWFWEQSDKADERRQVAAQVWRQALSMAVDGYMMGDGCGGMVEFQFTEECGLEYRNDGGDWTPVTGWDDLAPACFQGPPGADGSDGAAPEIRVYDGYIQWRLEGSVDWINLISVDDLMGDTGPQGPPGDTGLQGPPGETGAQGPPGDCDCTGGIEETFGEDGDGKRCDIASYFVDLILPDLVEQALNFSDTAATLSGFVSLVLGIVSAVGGPAGLAFAAGAASILAALFALDSGLIRDELTIGFWEDVRCRLRCVIPDNGVIDAAVQEEMALAVESITGSLQATTTVAGVIRAMAPGFIAQAGLLGSLYAGDCALCDDCPEEPEGEWCMTFDFSQSAQGWHSLNSPGSGWEGGYIAGVGFRCPVNRGLQIAPNFDAQIGQPTNWDIVGIQVNSNVSQFNLGGGGSWWTSGSNPGTFGKTGITTNVPRIVEPPNDLTASPPRRPIVVMPTVYLSGEQKTITSVTIWGDGPNPFINPGNPMGEECG